MNWLNELIVADNTKRDEEIAGKDGLATLWVLTADIGLGDLNPLVKMLLDALLDGDVDELLDGGKGIVVYAGGRAALCVLLVDLDAEVEHQLNPKHPKATWYPEGAPLPQWFGPRGERPVAAHVLAYAAERDETMDRGLLRGSVE